MKIPVLNELPAIKDNIEEFKGYNHNLRTEPGEWFNQKNMTTDFYPAASPRNKRSVQQKNESNSVVLNTSGTDITIKALEDNKGVCYLDNSLYTLHPLEHKISNNTEKKGYWFFKGNVPINYGFSNSIFEFQNATCVYSANSNKKILTVTLADTEIESGTINTGDIINFSHSTGSTLTIFAEGYKVTSVSNTGFECEKDGFGIGSSYVNVSLSVSNITTQIKNLYESSKAEYFNKNDDSYRDVFRMGSYLCTFPDGVIYETENTTESVPIYKVGQELPSDSYTFRTIRLNNTSEYYVKVELGENFRINDGQYQQYLSDQSLWVNLNTFVIIFKEYTTGTFDKFNVGDSITINPGSVLNSRVYKSGIFGTNTATESTVKILKKGTFASGKFGTTEQTTNRNTDYIIVAGHIEALSASNSDTQITFIAFSGTTIKRKCPDIKFACESQNRIWGCSKDGHEIYASALGNPYNFYDYSGLSTDSYAVNLGTYGDFTACINYLGRPLFFKENALHAISGSYPSNAGEMDGMSYSVTTTTEFKGVEKGSERSLAIIDNILYYKSAAGIVAFDGTNTAVISDALGKEKYKNAVAGAYNNKYYVSMQDVSGIYHLFVYDTEFGTWCREDNTHVLEFININNELLFLADDNKIYSVSEEDVLFTSDYEKEGEISWECETANYGYSYPNNKYLSRFQFRIQLTDGAKATFYIQYDSDGVWHRKGEMTGNGIKTHLFPIVPVRCDHMKIKIVGEGDAKIFSITKLLEEGGDVR